MLRDNVILITIDCLRADHLSCLGYRRNATANIDRIAKSGTLFTQAIANGPNTYCSFPSIFTSTFARMNKLGDGANCPSNWVFLSKRNLTIAEALKREGFSTFAFHNNPWLSSFFNYNRGFDIFVDFFDRELAKSFVLKEVSTKHRLLEYLQRLVKFYRYLGNQQGTAAGSLNRKAISLLSKHSSERFFLWLHYMDAHTPYIPPTLSLIERLDALRLYRKIARNEFTSESDLKKLVELYDAEIAYVDDGVKSLLDALAKIGVTAENSYIIITADHGEQLMEHGFLGHGMPYEENIHVPLIICGPEIEENVKINELVSLMDIAPTILELLNLKKTESFQGKSLIPSMKGEKGRANGIFTETINGPISFRTDRWKYIHWFDKKRENELYDIVGDPRETRNLAEHEKEMAKEFESIIGSHVELEQDYKKGYQEIGKGSLLSKQDKERIKARLKALGY